MFDVQFSSKARRFLKKIDYETWNRFMKKVKSLRIDPFPSDSKRVIGRKEKIFRVRVGDYRMLYIVFFQIITYYLFLILINILRYIN